VSEEAGVRNNSATSSRRNGKSKAVERKCGMSSRDISGAIGCWKVLGSYAKGVQETWA
jgi:hypothetical protein